VRITFRDPDCPEAVREGSAVVRKLILEGQGGREIHVALGGSDDNPGTKDRPLRRIARAAGLARPGDIVLIHAGTYTERDVAQGLRGAPDRPIIFAAAPGDRPVLDSSLVLAPGKTDWKAEGDGVYSTPLERKDVPGYVAQDG